MPAWMVFIVGFIGGIGFACYMFRTKRWHYDN